MGGIDKLRLTPVLNKAEQRIALILKIRKLFARLYPFQLRCFTMNEISEKFLGQTESLKGSSE